MLATNWTAVGGIAQLGAAAATVLLAVFTAVMARRTHIVANEAQSEVNEMRIDRQFQWQPQMELQNLSVSANEIPGSPEFTFRFSVRNNGAGPALQVSVAARATESSMSNWIVERLEDIRPGEVRTVQADSVAGGPLVQQFADPNKFKPHIVNSTLREFVCTAVFCTDVLGRQYRFLFTSTGDAIGTVHTNRLFPAEIVEVDEKERPSWAVGIP